MVLGAPLQTTKPLVVREAAALDSPKAGRVIAAETLVHVLDTRELDCGTQRALVCLEGTAKVEAIGWVSFVLSAGDGPSEPIGRCEAS